MGEERRDIYREALDAADPTRRDLDAEIYEKRDIRKVAQSMLGRITRGNWGYDLNGHIAIIEDDCEWGQTLFLIPGKTTPQLTPEDHANDECVRLCNEDHGS